MDISEPFYTPTMHNNIMIVSITVGIDIIAGKGYSNNGSNYSKSTGGYNAT